MPKSPLLAAIVLVLAGLVAGAAGGPAAAQERPAPEDRTAVRSVISDQIAAFLEDDAERAYSFAAPSIRRMFPSPEVFMRMVRTGYEPVYRAENPLFTRSLLLESDRILQEVVLTGPDGRLWTATYTLERQADGAWRITGCTLKEASGQAA